MNPQTSQGTYPFVVAILTGGESRRMGFPKPLIQLATGQTFLEKLYPTACFLNVPVVLLGTPRYQGAVLPKYWSCIEQNPLPVLEDMHTNKENPYKGPMGAFCRLLSDDHPWQASAYLVLACDQPLISKELLMQLVATYSQSRKAVFFQEEKLSTGLQPFPGIYPKTWQTSVSKAWQEEELSITRFIRNQADYQILSVPESSGILLRSLNTAKDVQWTNSLLANGL